MIGQENGHGIQDQQGPQLGWEAWPEELQGMQQQIDLNQAPVALEQELNEEPGVEDPLEMIINPA